MKTPSVKVVSAFLIGAVAALAIAQTSQPAASSGSTATPAPAAASASASSTAARARGGRGGMGNVPQTSKIVAARLENTPRHREFITVEHDGRKVQCFIVYPEVKGKAPAVMLIHEIFGLSDWMRATADQVAENGCIAIEPDLLSGMGPNGGGTSAYPSLDAITGAVSGLPAKQVTDDLNAVYDYVKKLDACNGNISVAGFCWGGGKAFDYAATNKELKAAFVFYGRANASSDLTKIACPVYGFYGEMDNNITPSVARTTADMKTAGKTYEPVTYAGAGHGFMREGVMDTIANPANKTAAEDAWKRWIPLLAKVNAPADSATAKPAAASATK
ncbi:MAG TPA: dienelactone hydrolase family protein [Opitutales bacterium]|nr:dienelactone hydrolase family protein [Opitutales bacterium]